MNQYKAQYNANHRSRLEKATLEFNCFAISSAPFHLLW